MAQLIIVTVGFVTYAFASALTDISGGRGRLFTVSLLVVPFGCAYLLVARIVAPAATRRTEAAVGPQGRA